MLEIHFKDPSIFNLLSFLHVMRIINEIVCILFYNVSSNLYFILTAQFGQRLKQTYPRCGTFYKTTAFVSIKSQYFQCSCLENPRDGGAWWAAVYGVAQSRTRLKRLSSSSRISYNVQQKGYANLWFYKYFDVIKKISNWLFYSSHNSSYPG